MVVPLAPVPLRRRCEASGLGRHRLRRGTGGSVDTQDLRGPLTRKVICDTNNETVSRVTSQFFPPSPTRSPKRIPHRYPLQNPENPQNPGRNLIPKLWAGQSFSETLCPQYQQLKNVSIFPFPTCVLSRPLWRYRGSRSALPQNSRHPGPLGP